MKKISLLFSILLFFACSENQSSKNADQQGKEINSSDPNVHLVNSGEESLIKTDRGSIIRIPKNAFVDQKGNPVSGEVAIHFEEFHDFADIALSGISMFYDSAGVRSDLRSAGMFRINGSKDGNPVAVAPDKKLTVDLSSLEDTPCYNFYKQEENGNWNYLHAENGQKPDSLSQIIMPKDPSQQDLSNALSIDVDYTDIPELNMYRSLIWRHVGNRVPSVMTSFNHKTAKILPVQDEFMTYELQVEKGGKIYKMKIQPILTGKNLELALNKYQHTIEKMQSDPNSIYYKAKMIRSVEIDGFGTYNWDVKNKREEDQIAFPLLAKVNGKEPQEIQLSLISATENIVVNYTKESLSEFSFDPKSKNLLLAFYDGDKVAVLTPDKFSRLRKMKGSKEAVSVNLEAKSSEKFSKGDLKKMICELIAS